MSQSAHATPRPAAAVILVRQRSATGELEVYLLRRHREATFMSSAFVFPGGTADADESDLRITAARELFEEAGVLLATAPVPAATRDAWRAAGDSLRLDQALASHQAAIDVGALHYYAHWITPSIEPKRFSAMFYLAVLPPDQTPSADNKETVDEIWVTPAEALARAGELRLPPPQLRTFLDMREVAEAGLDALLASCARRAEHSHAILPRMAPLGTSFALLLPWDPDYERTGTGDALPMPAGHPLAVGPSRFVLEDSTWKHLYAPSSPSAE